MVVVGPLNLLKFLFHTGSIKRLYWSFVLIVTPQVSIPYWVRLKVCKFFLHEKTCYSFYSILVRLKVNLGKELALQHAESFYSILVRLKGQAIAHHADRDDAFLFHTGSIKSGQALLPVQFHPHGFYSILVRLKVARR